MIRQINPGNLLPVYNSPAFQEHKLPGQTWQPFGMVCRASVGFPFQFLVPSGIALPTTTSFFRLSNADTGALVVDLSTFGEINQRADGRFWFTFKGMGPTPPTIAPGFYFYQITVSGNLFTTAVVEVVDDTCFDSWYELEFANATDKGDVLYQTGYVQRLALHPGFAFDAPEIEREIEATVNTAGAEISRFTRSVEKVAFEMWMLPDYAIYFLAMSADLSNLVLKDVKLAQATVLGRTSFSSKRQGPFFHIGRWVSETAAEVFTGCQSDFNLIG